MEHNNNNNNNASEKSEEEEEREKIDNDAHRHLLANEQRRVRPDRIVAPLGDIEIENDVGVSQPFGVSLVEEKRSTFRCARRTRRR